MSRPSSVRLGWLALLAVVVVAAGLSFLASGSPDGLESVADRLGFQHAATDPAWRHSPFADYEGALGVPTAVARVLGALLVLAVVTLLARLASRRNRP